MSERKSARKKVGEKGGGTSAVQDILVLKVDHASLECANFNFFSKASKTWACTQKK